MELLLPDKIIINPRTSNSSNLNAVRNPDGIFINTSVFREAAIHFTKYGYYTSDRIGTPDWREYWDRELDRCVNGYTVGGVSITGHHYGYLNYAPIERLDVTSVKGGGRAASKTTSFPDFWDGDYNYFWAVEIARNGCTLDQLNRLQLSVRIKEAYLTGALNLLVGKARRKGYSFKNAFICANNYNTQRKKLNLICAFDKKYLYGVGKGTMTMASNYLSFFNEHTAWGKKREFQDKIEAKKASYEIEIAGMKAEAGYQSEIIAITFKDNPDAARGKDPYLVLLEEMGAWPGSKDAWDAIAPSTKAGIYRTGQMIGFGTGGDMESGTADFASMFYNPEDRDILPFINIWDEEAENSLCAFFHPMQWNKEGFYDDEGNSDQEAALKHEAEYREKIRLNSKASSQVLQNRVQEEPTCPSEAFLTVSTNNFPVVEMRKRIEVIKTNNLDQILGQPVILYRDTLGKVRAKPDLDNELTPIWKRYPDTSDIRGAVIIWEYPNQNAPQGLYKPGYDPVAQDDGTSLNSITIIKGNEKNSATSNTIVAEYYGRGEIADDDNEQFLLLCELYNSPGMHENMVLHVKTYARRRNRLHWLALQPNQVISKAVKNSGVKRIYGCHMSDELKTSGEAYIKNWLLRVRGYDEDGKIITTIDTINSIGLLEELIAYNRKGNFDRVMSLMMSLFQIEEEELDYEYSEKEEKKNDLIDLMGKLYKRN